MKRFSDLLPAGAAADVSGTEPKVRLRETPELGVITDDDNDLPGDDLRTSHANDVGLNTCATLTTISDHQACCKSTYLTTQNKSDIYLILANRLQSY